LLEIQQCPAGCCWEPDIVRRKGRKFFFGSGVVRLSKLSWFQCGRVSACPAIEDSWSLSMPDVRRLVRHNQMMFRIEGTLHVVANGVGAVALRCHSVRIG
jgi:hypothetical protein